LVGEDMYFEDSFGYYLNVLGEFTMLDDGSVVKLIAFKQRGDYGM